DGALARLVAPPPDAARRDQAGDRGDVDDPAALAPPDHGPADQLGADERAREIEVDDLLPLLELEVLGRRVDPTAAHVVDEDVHRAVLLERRPACALRLERLAHVRL